MARARHVVDVAVRRAWATPERADVRQLEQIIARRNRLKRGSRRRR
jgi:hypothetical protein